MMNFKIKIKMPFKGFKFAYHKPITKLNFIQSKYIILMNLNNNIFVLKTNQLN